MPRTLSSDELFKRITSIDAFTLATVSPGDTALTANAAAGATALTVALITNFATLEPFFLNGDGGFELNEVNGAPAGSVITARYPLGKAQSIGCTVKEAVRAALGRIAQDGLGYTPSFSQSPIFSADAGVVGYFESDVEMGISFGLLGLNGMNIAHVHGAPDSLEFGTGVLATPYQVHVGGTDVGTIGPLAYRMKGTRYNGQAFHIDFLDARIEAAGEARFARNRELILPVAAKFTKLAWRIPV